MRRAFTLIELLVVIAIIAILAAILFPVFAQAKLAAKKTAALSQAKQTGTSMLLYTNDSDDTGPLGCSPDSANAGKWKPDTFTVQNPAGWFNYPIYQDEYATQWSNTTEPYRKSYAILDAPGMREVRIEDPAWTAGYGNRLKQPVAANFTYNGLLQSYSMTAVEAPSILPMVWQGQGNLSRLGAAMTNPRLACRGVGTSCVFNSGGPPMGDMAANARGDVFNIFLTGNGVQGASYYAYGQGLIYVASDSSAKLVKLGDGNKGAGNARLNTVVPFQFIEKDGTILSTNNYIRGGYAGQSLYTAAFMPTNSFAN